MPGSDTIVSDSTFSTLADRKIVVTGASSGIGRAMALEFARAGAHVIVHCHKSLIAAESVCTLCRELGRQAVVIAADLGTAAALSPFVQQAWDHWDGIDVWVNNAGADLLTGSDAKLDYAAKLQKLLDVDVRSTVLLSHDVGLRMKEAGQGVILNIGWDQADRGMGGDSGELFSVAKNAIMGFTRSLAVSLAPEVRVNCIAPGWIQTAWGETASNVWQDRVRRETPLERWGTPEDIASLARFLVSPAAAYLTGQVIAANGGAVR